MTQIINLYGGPGCGKSTSAAFLYYLLKDHGQNAELVREFVKNWAWIGRQMETYDQYYIMGKQIHYETQLYGKVDWIVTDSPVALGIVYSRLYNPDNVAKGVFETASSLYRQAELDGHKHHHVLLNRSKPYVQHGRYESEAKAKEIDAWTRSTLDALKFPYQHSNTDESSLRNLVASLVKPK
jgi:hypothetical protein